MSDKGISNDPSVKVAISGDITESMKDLIKAARAAASAKGITIVVSDEIAEKISYYSPNEDALTIREYITQQSINKQGHTRNKSDRKRNRADRWR